MEYCCCQLMLMLMLMLILEWSNAAAVPEQQQQQQQQCPQSSQYISGVGCCSVCPIGSGMVTQCRYVNNTLRDTVCRSCSQKSGTFSSVSNAISNCQQCKACQALERVASDCTPSSDTVCHCIDGHYRHRDLCLPCSKCQHGHGRVSACSHKRNTRCVKCGAGEFSAWCKLTHNFVCKPCPIACPIGYQLVTNCSRMSDTVCRTHDGQLANASELISSESPTPSRGGRRPPPPPSPPRLPPDSAGGRTVDNWKLLIDNGNNGNNAPLSNGGISAFDRKRGTGTMDDAKDDGSAFGLGSSSMIPIYCGILGAVIASLVVWILFKYLRSRAVGGKSHQHLQQHGSLALIPPQSPVYPPPNCQQPTPLVKRQSVDSGFFSNDALTNVSNSSRPLKDISESRFHRLENILSNCADPEGWKALAKELGFKEEEVTEFDTQSDIVKQSPIRLMLIAWRDREGATIGAFSRALQRVGRKDALILFKESERHHRHRSQHRGAGRKLQEESSLQEMCQV